MTGRVLVLGADGMLGHVVMAELRPHIETVGSTRNTDDSSSVFVDATKPQSVERALQTVQPRVVINCIGIVRQRSSPTVEGIAVNAMFPHVLGELARQQEAHLIHISTDCVFSGARGGYVEDDALDPVDAYGMTKALGEPNGPHVTTLRMTFVGRELRRRTGLLEWFLQERKCRGFRRHFFSVMSTRRVARMLLSMLHDLPAAGTYHVPGPRMSKYEFLVAVRDALHLDTEIIPDDATTCDRSLGGERFRRAFGLNAPTLTDILEDVTHGL